MEEFQIDFDQPEGDFILRIENNGESCWAYLIDSTTGKFLKDTFVFSPIHPSDELNKQAISEGYPPNLISKYASERAQFASFFESDLNVVWSHRSRSVAILYKSEPIAAIYSTNKRGFSKSLVGSSGFGEEWDQSLYNDHFTEYC